MGFAILTATLLLIQYGNAANLIITSPNASLTVLAEDPINLTISYSSTPTWIIWQYGNSILMASWINGTQWTADNYKNRLTLQEKNISIGNSATKDSGEYTVTVTDIKGNFGSFKFNVVVRERVLEIQSTDTGIYTTGANISLSIWYDGNPSEIFWFFNGIPLVIKAQSIKYVSDTITSRNVLQENGSLLIYNTTKDDAGNYFINVTATTTITTATTTSATIIVSGSRRFQVKFYDPVVNVTVTQSPQKASEGAAFVNLSCSASSGHTEMVTWMKDGQSVISKNAYSLLDGNWTLQITRPDRTFNGLYSCNVSNAADWGSGSLDLTVSYATLRATSTYSMMITTLLGGILLAHW
ncbi:hepatic and glial cell adhesion molecule-like [Lithobates pipiens]